MLSLRLLKNNSESLHRQICRQIRSWILEGSLPSGTGLPSTRELSSEYGISRNVFLNAYEQLEAEGYLEGSTGRGTFVSDNIIPLTENRDTGDRRLRLGSKASEESETIRFDFSIGMPDLEAFPTASWGRCLRKAAVEAGRDQMGYGNTGGSEELRKALSRHLLTERGIHLYPEQLFICSGSFQALLLAACASGELSCRRDVIIENPSYRLLAEGFLKCGMNPRTGECDEKGLILTSLRPDGETALVSTTPAHLFPSGGVFPIDRRLELCRMAEERDFYILENEFEGDIRLKGSPIPSLFSLSKDRIFRAAGFSQILYPAERIGYLAVPESLIEDVEALYARMGFGVSLSVQNALALMIDDGLLSRHYRKMKRRYLEKQSILLDALIGNFGDNASWRGQDTGTYVTVAFRGIVFDDSLTLKLRERGIMADYEYRHIHPPLDRSGAPGMLLGFGNLSGSEITEGIALLKELLYEQ